MPIKTVAKFEIKHLQVMNEKGVVDKKLLPKVKKETLHSWLRSMQLARSFSQKMLSLQRQGRMGTFAPVDGQEACQVGACAAITKDDWMVPAFREIGCFVVRGEHLVPMLLYNMGSEKGNAPEDTTFKNFPAAVPVGSQHLHAVGVAWAEKLKGTKNVAIVYGGDGSTSEGDFYEALNFAGVYQTPTIFLIQNNQWAISIPREQQTHAQTIAQKGIAAGVPAIQVDGNDIFAVYKAMQDAVKNARMGKGPTLIELVTYRLSMHTTADDPKVYRSENEVEEWKKKDPIDRLKKYMIKNKFLTKAQEQDMMHDIEETIANAVKEAESIDISDPKEMFKYHFESLPYHLQEQLEGFQ